MGKGKQMNAIKNMMKTNTYNTRFVTFFGLC